VILRPVFVPPARVSVLVVVWVVVKEDRWMWGRVLVGGMAKLEQAEECR
jgi:hypothetical protein